MSLRNVIKIVSGGQTGADRAGLDAAIALGLEYGGWIPQGRVAEDGMVPLEYLNTSEYSSPKYAPRTKANVRDSDATLIIVESFPLSQGTALTLRSAENHKKPHKVTCICDADAAEDVIDWLNSFPALTRPFVLNVAGPKESVCVGIQERGRKFLVRVLDDNACGHSKTKKVMK